MSARGIQSPLMLSSGALRQFGEEFGRPSLDVEPEGTLTRDVEGHVSHLDQGVRPPVLHLPLLEIGFAVPAPRHEG